MRANLNKPASKPVSRQASKLKTRQKLLAAALDVLVEEGYAGFSMNKVAKRAGIAQPSFYVHFDSVDDLFDALAEDIRDRFITPFQVLLNNMVADMQFADVAGIANRLFHLAFEIIKGQEALFRMMLAERGQPTSPLGRRIRVFFDELKSSWSALLVNIGLVPNDAEGRERLVLFLDGMFAMLETFALQWMDGKYESQDRAVDTLASYVTYYWAAELDTFFNTAKR